MRIGGRECGHSIFEARKRSAGSNFKPQKITERAGRSRAGQACRPGIDHALHENGGAVFHAIIVGRAGARSGRENGDAGEIGRAIQRRDRSLRKLERRESIGVPECGVRTSAGRSLNLVRGNVQTVLLNSPVRTDGTIGARSVVVARVDVARDRDKAGDIGQSLCTVGGERPGNHILEVAVGDGDLLARESLRTDGAYGAAWLEAGI